MAPGTIGGGALTGRSAAIAGTASATMLAPIKRTRFIVPSTTIRLLAVSARESAPSSANRQQSGSFGLHACAL